MKFLIILCEVLILGVAHRVNAQFSDKFHIRHLEPPEGHGYDLFYYDGVSLRDEKWRFDHVNQDTAVHRRFGLRNGQSGSQFHVVDTLSDANGFRQKTRILNDPASIESLLTIGIEPPATRTQSRDNSQHESKSKGLSSRFVNGVTLGVTFGPQNTQPGLQLNVPNLGFLSGGQPANEGPTPNRPPFGLPFFGNSGAPPPPPPPQQQPGIFGFPFGNRDPPPPPVVQQRPPEQNIFAGLQNLNIPFIGQPLTTEATTEAPTTNPSLFANLPFTFPSFGQSTTITTAAPETTTTAKGPFGFNLPSISGIFQNNNGKDANNKFGPPGHAHGHRYPPKHPHRPAQTSTEPPATTIQKEVSSTSDLSEFFPSFENVTEKVAPSRIEPSTEKLATFAPKETGLLQSDAVEQSTDPDITPTIKNPYVDSLIAVVDQNSYALGIQETTKNSFSSLEPAIISSVNVPQSVTELKTTTATDQNQNTKQIISDINSLSHNPPFPTMPSIVVEPPSAIFPTPLQQLAPPFETEPGYLGIHEDFVHSHKNTSESKDTAIPTVPGILELIRQSQEQASKEKYTQTDGPAPIELRSTDDIIRINSLGQDSNVQLPETDFRTPESEGTTISKESQELAANVKSIDKSAEIIRINSLEQDGKVKLPETNILPPFEDNNEQASEKTVTPLEIDLLPPFESSAISDDVQSTTTSTTAAPTTLTFVPVIQPELDVVSNFLETSTKTINDKKVKLPETDVLPRFEGDNEQATEKTTMSIELNHVITPEIDLLPPFESSAAPNDVQSPTTTIAPTKAAFVVVIPPEVDLLPPFEDVSSLSAPSTKIPQYNGTTAKPFIISVTQNNLIPLQPFEDELVPDAELTTTTNIPKITQMTQRTPHFISSTTTEAIMEIFNFTVPKIDLLPPFEEVTVAEELASTATNRPKTITTARVEKLADVDILTTFEPITTPPSINRTTITTKSTEETTTTERPHFVPEIELLPPFEDVSIVTRLPESEPTTNLPKTTSTISSMSNFTIPEIHLLPPHASVPVTDTVVRTTVKTPTTITVNAIRIPEIDLLPPFEEDLIPDLIENRSTTEKSSDLLPTMGSVNDTPSIHQPKIKIPDSGLFPTIEGDVASIITPKTTVTITPIPTTTRQIATTTSTTYTVPDVGLLPPFESVPVSDLVVNKITSTTTIIPKTIVTKTTTQPTLPAGTPATTEILPPETELLPPLESNSVGARPTLFKVVTSTPGTVKNIEPIYQRTTLVTPDVKSRFTGNQLSENFVVPNIDLRSQQTVKTKVTNLKSITTIPTTTKLPKLTVKPVAPVQTPSKYFLPPFNSPSYSLPSTPSTTKLITTHKPVTVAFVQTPSKYFLPPFKSPSDSLKFSTSLTNLTEPFNDSTDVGTAQQLDQSTINNKIVNSVRNLIEHSSQKILPNAVSTASVQETTRFIRAPPHKHHHKSAYHEPRRHHNHNNRYNNFYPNVRHPVQELQAPPKLNPGQLDVYTLDRYMTQGGQSLDGPYFNTAFSEYFPMPPPQSPPEQHLSEIPVADPLETTTTEGVPILPPAADGELSTKPAITVKRPVFVNVDDEDDTESTTSLLDTKLNPNAIKSLIG